MNNINDILKQLEKSTLESSIDVFIPSLNREVKFKTLNLKQQKDLLKSTMEDSLLKLSFNNLLTDIIRTNNINKDIIVDTLSTIDRTSIALELRAKSIDQEYIVQDKKISLNKILQKNRTNKLDLTAFSETITTDSIVVELSAPILGKDYQQNTQALRKLKDAQVDDIKSTIGDLIVYEFMKFITKISLISEGQVMDINYDTLKFGDKITIAENLTSNVTNSIFAFIKKYRTLESTYLTDDVTNMSIDIDGNFFTV